MKVSAKIAVAASVLTLGLASAQATNLLGIDVSNWQGSINWSSVAGCGPKYAFCKATEGTYYQDGTFNANMNNGKAAGLMMGAYHFARPDTTCPSAQANYFWNFAGGKIIADGKSLYPMVDFETYNGAPCTGNYTAWFNTWSSNVKAKTTRYLRPVIYSSAGAGMCYLTTACTLSAWVANYNGQNLYTGQPWTCCTSCNYVSPGTTSGWTYWQVSSTGAICGISGGCDLDAYPATLAELKTWQGVQ